MQIQIRIGRLIIKDPEARRLAVRGFLYVLGAIALTLPPEWRIAMNAVLDGNVTFAGLMLSLTLAGAGATAVHHLWRARQIQLRINDETNVHDYTMSSGFKGTRITNKKAGNWVVAFVGLIAGFIVLMLMGGHLFMLYPIPTIVVGVIILMAGWLMLYRAVSTQAKSQAAAAAEQNPEKSEET